MTKILILGCGNILFGDDGFGVEVVRKLTADEVSAREKGRSTNRSDDDDHDRYYIMEAGTSVRKILFNLIISDEKPKRIIIVDAVDLNRKPGEIFELKIDEIPVNKIDDFSLHQTPTTNLLRELKEFCGVDIIILVSQIRSIPEQVEVGLSEPLRAAVPEMCELVKIKINEEVVNG